MPKQRKRCPTCGANMDEYQHVFSKALAVGLFRLYKANKPTNLKELELTRNQWDNFQKLRYWNLVEKYFENGKRVAGKWAVTPFGKNFIEGKDQIHTHAKTYRGKFIAFFGKLIDFECPTLPVFYKKREDYAATAQAHE